jgi:hypothetical protein
LVLLRSSDIPHKTLRIYRSYVNHKLKRNCNDAKSIMMFITFVKLYLLRSLFVDLIYTIRIFLNG